MRSVPVVQHVEQVRHAVRQWRGKGQRIALVPTMGALHEGHLSLIKLARRHARRVIVSIFINPAQFGPEEDFSAYPRDETGDRRKLARSRTDLIYMPSILEMYPEDFSTRIEVAELTQGLCGASRPHHFAGVTTVVAKLFLQTLPDVAVFGEKDYQQLLVIRRMTEDLNFPIEIIGAPILREKDGLAMSSRNAYLSAAEREIAPQLYHVLSDMAVDLARGRSVENTLQAGGTRLHTAGFRIDYLDVRSADRLIPLEGTLEGEQEARVFAAVFLGKTRLIDNVRVPKRRQSED